MAKRAEILSKDKATLNSKVIEETYIIVAYTNIRSLNGRSNKQMLNDWVRKEQLDIHCLSETKLTWLYKIRGFKHIQTKLNRTGGSWIGSKHDRVKKIRTVGDAIIWVSVAYQFVPLHIFCSYIKPGNKAKGLFYIE